MRPRIYEIGQYAGADTAAIAALQTVTAGTPMTLTSSPYVADVPRTVSITSAADESGNRFSIRGKGPKGNEIYDTVTGANAGTAESTKVFSEVLSITPEVDGSGNVSAGIVDVVPTPWFPVEYAYQDISIGILLEVVGTVTAGATLEATMDQLGYNDRSPIRGGHHGTVFDIVSPISNIEDITNEILGAADVGSDTRLTGAVTRPITAIRAKSNEALGADELVRFQLIQGSAGSAGFLSR